MSEFNEKISSLRKTSLNKLNLPVTPESKILSNNELCKQIKEESSVKFLLSMDETILNNIELNDSFDQANTKINNSENKEKSCINDFPSNCILNKSHIYVDNFTQNNYNYKDCNFLSLENKEFEKHNRSICEDLNDSVHLLKTKLFNSNITLKRKNIDHDNNNKCIKYSFYGLPDKVKELVKKYKGINKLYDWQDECLKLKAINDRKNLVYALPTSGGKTLVAEILMLKEITCNKKNAIFILPFVALVKEKIQSMTPFALELDFLIEEYAAEKGHYPPKKRRKKNTIYISTIEKAQTIINCLIELDRLSEIGIIVIDELHLLGEGGGRGATLECLLTKVMYLNNNIQLVAMSATIGNLEEISTFLNAELYIQNFRPVVHTEYVKCENEIWLIDTKKEEIFIDKKIINYRYTEKALQLDPDCLGGLVMDIVPKDSCLIFCSNRKNCENVANLLTHVLFRSLETYKVEEKLMLLKALEIETGKICPIMKKTIKLGVAYHHSGLTTEERRIVEEGFKNGVLCVICCTSTLAAGVNLPARRVILRSPYIGNQFLNISRYKQMVGRAGRAGLGEIGESILICTKNDIAKVHQLLTSKMDESISSLHSEKDRGINNLIISSVLLSVATTRSDIHKIISKTLLKIQENKLNINTKEITDKALATLLKSGIIRVKQKTSTKTFSKLDTSVIFPTQIQDCSDDEISRNNEKKQKKYITLINSTQLELCPLGRAAMKGSIDLNTAHVLYEDLKKAQNNLILVDYIHLLYLVTPYDIYQIKPVGTVYYDAIMSLAPHQMQVARLLGVNEAVVEKLRVGITPKHVDMKVVQRFYVTLILHELWNHQSIFNVADKYQINRGTIQNLLSSASAFSSSVVRFCQELDEFWAFKDLFTSFGQKLTYCCVAELEPLMELPYVKIGRAKQLYKAGYKTLQSIAKAKPEEMLKKIEHLPKRVVSQIISAAKLLLLQKVENLRDEVEEVLDGLEI